MGELKTIFRITGKDFCLANRITVRIKDKHFWTIFAIEVYGAFTYIFPLDLFYINSNSVRHRVQRLSFVALGWIIQEIIHSH